MFRKSCALLVSSCIVIGCTTSDTSTTPTTPGGPSPDAGSAVDPTSRAPQLQRKTGGVLARDLAQALELPRDAVCRELGIHDCAEVAHRIVLGGVEPYVLRVDEPIPGTAVSAPIAADRLALAACGERARRDFERPGEAVLFGALARGGDPASARADAVGGLYRRLLAREPDPSERAALEQLAAGPATDQDFAVLACFTIATTLEHLFY